MIINTAPQDQYEILKSIIQILLGKKHIGTVGSFLAQSINDTYFF